MFKKHQGKATTRNQAAKVAEDDAEKDPMAVIVVTDIGADIDDTLALFTLLGAKEDIKIVAIVTSVNNGRERAIVANGFLELLGGPEIEILPYDDDNKIQCLIPEGFQNFVLAEKKIIHTPRRILEICQNHIKDGVLIYGIGGLTPIAAAISEDSETNFMLQAVRGVYLQGNVTINDEKRLVPSKDAFNFKNDMEAATTVFDHFQTVVPIVTLGKFAAYEVDITKADFNTWTAKLKETWDEVKAEIKLRGNKSILEIESPNLLDANRELLRRLLATGPATFYRAYKEQTAEQLTKENFSNWFKENSKVLKGEEVWRKIWEKDTKDFADKIGVINTIEKGDDFESWYGRQKEKRTIELIAKEEDIGFLFSTQKRTIKATVPVIKLIEEEEFDDWFVKADPTFKTAHPYDPLLALRMILDVKKMKEILKEVDVKSFGSQGETNIFFEDSNTVEVDNNITHVLLGNEKKKTSVPSSSDVGRKLKEHIFKGLEKIGNSYNETKSMTVPEGVWRSLGFN